MPEAGRTIQVLYFAWLRERVGTGEETVALPPAIMTVGDLTEFLPTRSEGHALAFAQPEVIRCAVNQTFADPATVVEAGDEVAFFPPVTGG